MVPYHHEQNNLIWADGPKNTQIASPPLVPTVMVSHLNCQSKCRPCSMP